MDKNEAFLWVIRADIQLSLCKNEEAIDSFRQAKDIALRFDEAPNYSAAYYTGKICYDGYEIKNINSESLYDIVSMIQI